MWQPGQWQQAAGGTAAGGPMPWGASRPLRRPAHPARERRVGMTAVIRSAPAAAAAEIEGEVLFGRSRPLRHRRIDLPGRARRDRAAAHRGRHGDLPRGRHPRPRGGGTSQCGYVNRALVIDCSCHLNRVLSVEGDRACRSRASLLQLNALIRSDRPVLPGRSLHQRLLHHRRHGRQQLLRLEAIRLRLMADLDHAIDAILADGSRHRFGLPANLPPRPPRSWRCSTSAARAGPGRGRRDRRPLPASSAASAATTSTR